MNEKREPKREKKHLKELRGWVDGVGWMQGEVALGVYWRIFFFFFLTWYITVH